MLVTYSPPCHNLTMRNGTHNPLSLGPCRIVRANFPMDDWILLNELAGKTNLSLSEVLRRAIRTIDITTLVNQTKLAGVNPLVELIARDDDREYTTDQINRIANADDPVVEKQLVDREMENDDA